MLDEQTSIEDYIRQAAAKQPTPGGGSVSALVGALSAAMAEMAVNYSLGKKDLAAHQPELETALAELTRARELMLVLMVEDQAAYEAMTAAKKARNDPDYAAALQIGLSVPRALAAAALAVLERCVRLQDKVNKYLLSDLLVSADLAMATVRCALHNVKINLPELTDEAQRSEIEKNNRRLLAHAVEMIQKLKGF